MRTWVLTWWRMSHLLARHDRMQVSEIRVVWSPKMAPARMADTVRTISVSLKGAAANWVGTAMGNRMAIVPQLVPVANEMMAARTKVRTGMLPGSMLPFRDSET